MLLLLSLLDDGVSAATGRIPELVAIAARSRRLARR
jgi:hypothetical protein